MSAKKDAAPELVEDGETKPAAAPNKKKKLIMIGAAAALVLGGGGGAAAFFMGGSKAEATEGAKDAKPAKKEKAEAKGEGAEGKDAFVDVPPMVVNIRSPDGAARFLKVHLMLVPGEDTNAEGLKEKLPVLLDAYQPFLRELRPEDLAGSAAVFRVKEELMIRSRDALGDGQINDILIQDLVQQ